ncbi:hypothetical protein C8R43DRAFT_1045308 [Mycena crocata]|nr:hypothetical protein C8R43DRAFT_1045308 [Mycena crocata]
MACSNCRRRKVKCIPADVDHPTTSPCARCTKRRLTCQFTPVSDKDGYTPSPPQSPDVSNTSLPDFMSRTTRTPPATGPIFPQELSAMPPYSYRPSSSMSSRYSGSLGQPYMHTGQSNPSFTFSQPQQYMHPTYHRSAQVNAQYPSLLNQRYHREAAPTHQYPSNPARPSYSSHPTQPATSSPPTRYQGPSDYNEVMRFDPTLDCNWHSAPGPSNSRYG